MDGLTILIPLAPFLMVAALVIVPRWLRNRERRDMQLTLRTAIEKGQPLPPEVIEAISRDTPAATPAKRARDDLRSGVVWLAVALGIVTFGWVGYYYGDFDGFAALAGLACIPGFIGLALIALGLLDRMGSDRRANRDLA